MFAIPMRPGRVDDFSFFYCLSPFCFLLIEYHCIFSSSYKILSNYVYYYCIMIVQAIGTFFFFRACFTSFRTHALAVLMRECLGKY